MNLEMGEIKNGTYFNQWRKEMSPTAKKRWRRFWTGFTLLWLTGALYAPTAVAGIARLKPAGHCSCPSSWAALSSSGVC